MWNGQSTRIQITYTSASPLTAILVKSWGTVSVNILSWEMAFSLFPDATFRQRKCYALQKWRADLDTIAQQHEQHGWEVIKDCGDCGLRFPQSMNRSGVPRGPGDSFTWRMLLETSNVCSGGIPSSVFQFSFFTMFLYRPLRLARQMRREQYSYYTISAEDFKSSALRYDYTFPGGPEMYVLSPADFWASVRLYTERLSSRMLSRADQESRDRLLMLGRTRWSPLDRLFYSRPSTLWHLAEHIRETVPNGWVFHDEHIPLWYRAWQLHQGVEQAVDAESYLKALGRCKLPVTVNKA
jgi:hypothetical protein